MNLQDEAEKLVRTIQITRVLLWICLFSGSIAMLSFGTVFVLNLLGY